MDEATKWTRRTFYLGLLFGIATTSVAVATWLGWKPLGIPVKVNIDSGGKPNGVPERL